MASILTSLQMEVMQLKNKTYEDKNFVLQRTQPHNPSTTRTVRKMYKILKIVKKPTTMTS